MRIHQIRVDESRIQKEKVADSKLSGYEWTRPKRLLAVYKKVKLVNHL